MTDPAHIVAGACALHLAHEIRRAGRVTSAWDNLAPAHRAEYVAVATDIAAALEATDNDVDAAAATLADAYMRRPAPLGSLTSVTGYFGRRIAEYLEGLPA